MKEYSNILVTEKIESNLSRNYLSSGVGKMIGFAKFVVVYGILCGPRLNSCPSLLFVSDHYSVLKIQGVTRSLELSDGIKQFFYLRI